jgi:hypothetical protein
MRSRLVLLLALIALTLLVGIGVAQETYVLWGDPQKGRKVYADHGCANCHAVRGVGGTLGPDLGRPPLYHKTVTQMAGVMWNHAPQMRKKILDSFSGKIIKEQPCGGLSEKSQFRGLSVFTVSLFTNLRIAPGPESGDSR